MTIYCLSSLYIRLKIYKLNLISVTLWCLSRSSCLFNPCSITTIHPSTCREQTRRPLHSRSSQLTLPPLHPLKPVVFLQVSVLPFGGSAGAPRHCPGAPDLIEQRETGLGKSNHSPIIPLTSTGFCHSAQCPAFTSLLVRFGTKRSIPSDKLGGNAASSVAWMNKTGISIVFFSSLRNEKTYLSAQTLSLFLHNPYVPNT